VLVPLDKQQAQPAARLIMTTNAVPRCSSLDLPGLLSTMTVDVLSAAEADLPYEIPHPKFYKLNAQTNVH
jgi:hypothetical protein